MALQRLPNLPDLETAVPNTTADSVARTGTGPERVAELPLNGRPGTSTDSPDLQAFVSHAVELARILTGASGSAIALREERGTVCRAVSGEGAPPPGALVDISSGITKQCLDSGASLVCDDITTDGRVDPEIADEIGIRSVAVVPIYAGDEVWGILEVLSGTPGVFTGQHVQRLERLANWVGTAATGPGDESVDNANVDAAPAPQESSWSLADQSWNDVLLDTHTPWKWFLQSVLAHVVVVGVLAGISRIYPQEIELFHRPLRDAEVTYYPFSQSFPQRESLRPVIRTRVPVAAPSLTVRPSRTLGLSAAVPILPAPPDVHQAARQMKLPEVSAVAPLQDVSAGAGLRRMKAPSAAVVPPPPDVRGAMAGAEGKGAGRHGGASAGVDAFSIVPPPPSLNDHAALSSRAAGLGARTGVQVVEPPPSLDGNGTSVGKGRTDSLGAGGSQVIAPPPSLNGIDSTGTGRGVSLLAKGGSEVVPPAPSIDGGGNSGGGRRAGVLAGGGDQGVSPPASPKGVESAEATPAPIIKEGPAPSVPSIVEKSASPILQDVRLRVIGLAWAPPRSSYFSNFEVFIAEAWLKNEQSQFVKLVYVFLPYQLRLSEYGFDNAKVRRLRVTRDPTCDESLLHMTLAEEQSSATGVHTDPPPGETFPGRTQVLPCYRTTADDYRRAISKGH